MFQPQPTPFAFSYGVRDEADDYGSFQQASLGLQAPGPVSAGAGGAAALGLFAAPAFSSAAPGPAFPSYGDNISNNLTPPPPRKMEPSAPDDDLAAQEAAAREYQPQLEGPLVGEKTPSHAITEAYAKADPTYVAKTLALPQTYSHYRPIQGDGNCGWRAIGFSYFEALIHGGDRAKIETELQRISQLDQYIVDVGQYNPFVFEDMVKETKAIYGDILECLPSADTAMAILTAKFNDPARAQDIMYHLRLLAASWLKGHVDTYQDFIQGSNGVQGFCLDWLERVDREIDHVGITLLSDVLLKPAGIYLEIAYLDRSEGDQVNVYRFPDEPNAPDLASLGPVVYLLFRPDHYDILYKAPPTPINIMVNRVTSFSHKHDITSNTTDLHTFSRTDLSTLSLLPGFSGPLSPLAAPAASPLGDFTPSPQSPWIAQSPFADCFPQRTPQAAAVPPAASNSSTTNHQVRFSRWQYPQLMENPPLTEPVFTTNSFKNSHFNTAHYNNPNFQPEEYRPDSEEGGEHARGRKRSTRSSYSNGD